MIYDCCRRRVATDISVGPRPGCTGIARNSAHACVWVSEKRDDGNKSTRASCTLPGVRAEEGRGGRADGETWRSARQNGTNLTFDSVAPRAKRAMATCANWTARSRAILWRGGHRFSGSGVGIRLPSKLHSHDFTPQISLYETHLLNPSSRAFQIYRYAFEIEFWKDFFIKYSFNDQYLWQCLKIVLNFILCISIEKIVKNRLQYF